MAAKKFITNTLLLTATSTALRIVGMAYRIFISRQIGEAGMGLYQLIQSVYMLCSTLATAGISVAVTRLISEQCVTGNPAGMKRVMRFALRWSASVSAMVSAVLLLGGGAIAAHLIRDPAAAASLRVLAFGLPFMAMSGCFSGYFLARGRAGDVCIAQLFEQAVRIGVVVATIDRYRNVASRCMGVFVGNMLSEIAACAVLGALCLLDLKHRAPTASFVEQRGSIFSKFFPIVLPIAGAKNITSLLHAAENLLVPILIARFTLDKQTALSQFGALKGMALPILMFPSSFLTTIATLLIPEITTAAALRKQDKIAELTDKALRITMSIAILMGGLFFTFAAPLGQILYHSDSVGDMLRTLAPVVPFMYLDCIADGLLKGLGEQMSTLRYNIVDSSLRLCLLFLLLPYSGINGFLVIMLISNTLVSFLEVRRLLRVSRTKLSLGAVLPPLIAVCACHALCAVFFRTVTGPFSLIAAGFFYLALYALVLLPTGALSALLPIKNRRL